MHYPKPGPTCGYHVPVNSFCFVRGSFWASGEALHGAPLAESANPPKSSKPRVFPHFGSKFAQKHAFFYVFGFKNALKPRVFPRFGVKFAQKRVFFHVFGFKMPQSHAFFHVLASNLLKNACFSTFLASKCLKATLFSTFWLQNCSKTRVFPRFGFRIPQKHACFHVFGFKTVCFSTFWLQNCSKTRVFQCFCFQSGSKPRVFPSFGFNIVQKRALHNFFFTNCYSCFSTFLVWRGSKKHFFFFPCVFFQNFAMQGVFFTDRRLCTQVLRARKLLHTDDLHTDNLHTDSFVQQTALHT